MRSTTRFEGWNLTRLAAGLIALGSLAITLADGASEDSLRVAIRMTARTSFVLFVLAFSASSLHRFWANDFSRWQLRNRRYLGVSFAASHGVHALAIIALAVLHPASFQEHTRTTSVGPGVIAYAFIIAMALTSSNKSVALIGTRAWKVLHTIGSLYIWVAFAKAFFIRTPLAALYWVPFAILVAALVLRIASWRMEARPSIANALSR
jgi:hypothetical protein